MLYGIELISNWSDQGDAFSVWPHRLVVLDLTVCIIKKGKSFNLSFLSVAYWRQWTGSSLIRVMACCLVGATPLPELMLTHCQLDPKEQTELKSKSKYIFPLIKCIWKCHLRHDGPFVQGEWVDGPSFIVVVQSAALNWWMWYFYLFISVFLHIIFSLWFVLQNPPWLNPLLRPIIR